MPIERAQQSGDRWLIGPSFPAVDSIRAKCAICRIGSLFKRQPMLIETAMSRQARIRPLLDAAQNAESMGFQVRMDGPSKKAQTPNDHLPRRAR
jgi:hypothetical protein